VTCGFSREMLALHVEGDLSEPGAEVTARHLSACGECREFLEQLRTTQSLLKSIRRETVSPSECAAMRRDVMSIINDRRDGSGWALRVERAIVLGARRRSYALAASALLAILSVSVLAQIRHTAADATQFPALFEGKDTLVRPEGYRAWVLVGSSADTNRPGVAGAASAPSTPTPKVYIDPSGYREYEKTGRFPEGTLMVWESVAKEAETAQPHGKSAMLLASVKDSARFAGGWGFFDFTGPDGAITSTARALPDSSGCRACHRQGAETDHVFTQYYPVLRAAQPRVDLAVPPRRASPSVRYASLHMQGSRAILTLSPFRGSPYDTSIYQNRSHGIRPDRRLLGPDGVHAA